MRHRRGIIAIAFVLSCVATAFAQSVWEGTAVVGRYGDFPPDGLFAASDSFALNSVVDVTNLTTGRSARLVVVRRSSDPGILLVLSGAAAAELGVQTAQTAMIRARVVAVAGLTAVSPNEDLPFHPDPDINPAAALGDPNVALIMPRDTVARAPAAPATPSAPSAPATRPTTTAPATPSAPSSGPITAATTTAPVAPVAPPTPIPVEQPDATAPVQPIEPIISLVEPSTTPVPATDADQPTVLDETQPEPASPPEIDTPPEPSVPQLSSASGGPGDSTPADQGPDVVGVPERLPPPIIGATVVVAPQPRAGDAEVDAPDTVEASLPWRMPAPSAVLVVDLPLVPEPDLRIAAADTLSPPADSIPSDEDAGLPEAAVADAPSDDTLGVLRAPTEPFPAVAMPTPDVIGAPEEPMLAAEASAEDTLPPAVAESAVADLGLREIEVDSPIEPTEPVGEPAPQVVIQEPPAPEERIETTEQPRRPALIPDDALIVLEPAEPRAPPAGEPSDRPAPPAVPTDEEPMVTALPQPTETEEEMTRIADVADGETAGVEPTGGAAAGFEPTGTETVAGAAVAAEIPASVPDAGAAAAPSDLPLIERLEPGAVYLQVAAFRTAQSALPTVAALRNTFPVAIVQPTDGDHAVYRVVVGPIDEDEKGTVLVWMRNRGYRDAFVRRD